MKEKIYFLRKKPRERGIEWVWRLQLKKTFLIQFDIVFLKEKFQTVRKQRGYLGKIYIWKCYFVLKKKIIMSWGQELPFELWHWEVSTEVKKWHTFLLSLSEMIKSSFIIWLGELWAAKGTSRGLRPWASHDRSRMTPRCQSKGWELLRFCFKFAYRLNVVWGSPAWTLRG